MTVALAAAWRPCGEGPRLAQALLPLRSVYGALVVAVDAPMAAAELAPLAGRADPTLVRAPDQATRYGALERALQTDARSVHYCDLDRLLHWPECQPEEWCAAVAAISRADLLVFGRTPAALATHPRRSSRPRRSSTGSSPTCLALARRSTWPAGRAA